MEIPSINSPYSLMIMFKRYLSMFLVHIVTCLSEDSNSRLQRVSNANMTVVSLFQ